MSESQQGPEICDVINGKRYWGHFCNEKVRSHETLFFIGEVRVTRLFILGNIHGYVKNKKETARDI